VLGPCLLARSSTVEPALDKGQTRVQLPPRRVGSLEIRVAVPLAERRRRQLPKLGRWVQLPQGTSFSCSSCPRKPSGWMRTLFRKQVAARAVCGFESHGFRSHTSAQRPSGGTGRHATSSASCPLGMGVRLSPWSSTFSFAGAAGARRALIRLVCPVRVRGLQLNSTAGGPEPGEVSYASPDGCDSRTRNFPVRPVVQRPRRPVHIPEAVVQLHPGRLSRGLFDWGRRRAEGKGNNGDTETQRR
jgi:hypothetical protein